VRIKLKLSSN